MSWLKNQRKQANHDGPGCPPGAFSTRWISKGREEDGTRGSGALGGVGEDGQQEQTTTDSVRELLVPSGAQQSLLNWSSHVARVTAPLALPRLFSSAPLFSFISLQVASEFCVCVCRWVGGNVVCCPSPSLSVRASKVPLLFVHLTAALPPFASFHCPTIPHIPPTPDSTVIGSISARNTP